MTQSELNSHLYQSANILHGSIDSSAYKHNIFGMIFLKRLSDPFDENVEKINSELISEGIDSKKTEKVARYPIAVMQTRNHTSAPNVEASPFQHRRNQ